MKKPIKVFIFFAIMIVVCTGWIFADETTTKSEKSTEYGWPLIDEFLYFDIFIIQPNAFLYFDQGDDGDRTETVDFYTDGSAGFSVSLFGGDIFLKGDKVDFGLSVFVGVSSDIQKNEYLGGYMVAGAGLFLSYKRAIRLEGGISVGVTALESYSNPTDIALYIGLSFPTNLSKILFHEE
ncbi:MAG: hypothetical protein KAQ93_07910 [Spirochaetales bacterium]|nr:hypothetical protein [Spirochaetales bacterium]